MVVVKKRRVLKMCLISPNNDKPTLLETDLSKYTTNLKLPKIYKSWKVQILLKTTKTFCSNWLGTNSNWPNGKPNPTLRGIASMVWCINNLYMIFFSDDFHRNTSKTNLNPPWFKQKRRCWFNKVARILVKQRIPVIRACVSAWE